MHTAFLRHATSMLLLSSLFLLPSNKTMAGVDACLKAAVAMASPSDMAKAASFASNHPTCLANLAPPQLVPYATLSGSLDVANSSGFLKQVGLQYSDYATCTAKFDPAQTSLKAMAPVIKPVCGQLGINCQALEQEGANQANAQLAEQIPIIGMLPCACAAANSGLGVAKIADLVKKTEACGGTLAEAGAYLLKGAEGAYDIGKSVASSLSSAAGSALNTIKDAACEGASYTGLVSCGSDPPPPPPPPTAQTVANLICASYGGVYAVKEKDNPPNDFSLKCNDGSMCSQKPGGPLQCTSAADQAAAIAKRDFENSILIAQNEFWCGQRRDQLKTETMKQCRDADCRFASGLVIASFHGTCLDSTKGDMAQSAPAWAIKGETKYTDNLKVLVNESVMRDTNASNEDKMRANGCRTFLGRANEFNCTTDAGFELCKRSVDAGELSKCYLAGGGEYPDLTINPALYGALAKSRATNIPATTSPKTAPSTLTEVTPISISNSTLLRATQATSATETPAIVVSDTFLANAALKGCRPFLGRRDELKCDNQAGFDECMQAVNRNMLKQCHNAVNDKP